MINRILQWLGRKAILYVLLVLAIAACTFALPWIKQVAIARTPTQTRAYVLENAAGRIASERDQAAALFSAKASELRHETTDKLKERQRGLKNERAVLVERIRAARPAWMLAIVDEKMLLANERTKLRIAVIDQELAAVSAALNAAASDGAFIAAKTSLERQRSQVRRLVPLCNQANRKLAGFQQQWRWKLRQWLESEEHRSLVRKRDQRCDAARVAVARRDQLSKLAGQKEALSRHAQQAFARVVAATGLIKKAGVDLAQDAERAQIELSGSFPERLSDWWERWKLKSVLRSAALALALIIAMPFLIRLLCYFLLAPLAMRRSAIRLSVPYEGASAIEPAGPSTTSVSVRLTHDEELLVRQDYLQTTSHSGTKGTQWWLDWKKPITSIATGMTFLTRIRGDGEVTTVSAVRDGLAEVTILTLPQGGACVLQPRALAAIAQPIRRPLRITRHWRLTSLNAWLTLQLRYLVFHGPARLVLKGGRGVRVEAAERGRVFGQDQLLGFSADLAYSVTRTETFWPYFLGREQLLKDRVMAGQGVLIIEEAPLTARRGEVRRGLEGLIDAGMKVFGM